MSMQYAVWAPPQRGGAGSKFLEILAAILAFFRNAAVWIANPLEKELQAAGITVLPKEQVRKHMREMVLAERTTWLAKVFGAVFDLFRSIFWVAFLAFIVGGAMVLSSNHLGLLLIVLFGVGYVFMMFALLVDAVVELISSLSAFTWLASWSYSLLRTGDWDDCPEHIVARGTHARKHVPNARLEIARLEDDPFLFACRRRLLIVKRVPIGAWDTGTSLDDM
jgi:hypothetical protein